MNGAVSTAVSSSPAFAAWMRGQVGAIERELDAQLPPATQAPSGLHEAMRYAVLAGGKRIRPLLCLAAGDIVGAPARVVRPVAASVELIHVFSLIQDDLPSMDNDVLRHGKPALHVRYGEAVALLACDGLLALAFQILSELPLPGDVRAALVRELALAGGTGGLSGGQYLDICGTGRRVAQDDLEMMDRLKTAELIRAALRMGAMCGEGPAQDKESVLHALGDYASHMGLAFQVVDDILDVQGNTDQLGKTAGKDALAGKTTYVSELGLDGARDLVHRLRAQACLAVGPLGPRAERLRELADFVVSHIH